MSLQKCVVFRGGTDVRPDDRAYYMMRLNTMPCAESRYFIYPRMFALHNLPEGAGQPAPDDAPEDTRTGRTLKVPLPPMQNLSADRLTSDGVVMLENSVECVVWIGRATNPTVLQALFGVQTLDQ